MEERIITEELVAGFVRYLLMEEKSRATQQKYVRDVQAFRRYAAGSTVTKELVISYKKPLY